MGRNTNKVPDRKLRAILQEAVDAGGFRSFAISGGEAPGERRHIRVTLADGSQYDCLVSEAIVMAEAATAAALGRESA